MCVQYLHLYVAGTFRLCLVPLAEIKIALSRVKKKNIYMASTITSAHERILHFVTVITASIIHWMIFFSNLPEEDLTNKQCSYVSYGSQSVVYYCHQACELCLISKLTLPLLQEGLPEPGLDQGLFLLKGRFFSFLFRVRLWFSVEHLETFFIATHTTSIKICCIWLNSICLNELSHQILVKMQFIILYNFDSFPLNTSHSLTT